jgi:hypothetical protein
MPAKRRPFSIQVLVSAAERDEVRRAAERHALSASSYARALMLDALRREVKLEQRIDQRLGILEQA